MSPLLRSGWLPARTGSAPTLLRRGLSGCAASQGRVFSFPALGTRCAALVPDRMPSSRTETSPLCNVEWKRHGWVLIVFQRRASPRERNLFLFAIGNYSFIDEFNVAQRGCFGPRGGHPIRHQCCTPCTKGRKGENASLAGGTPRKTPSKESGSRSCPGW